MNDPLTDLIAKTLTDHRAEVSATLNVGVITASDASILAEYVARVVRIYSPYEAVWAAAEAIPAEHIPASVRDVWVSLLGQRQYDAWVRLNLMIGDLSEGREKELLLDLIDQLYDVIPDAGNAGSIPYIAEQLAALNSTA